MNNNSYKRIDFDHYNIQGSTVLNMQKVVYQINISSMQISDSNIGSYSLLNTDDAGEINLSDAEVL